jgi:hypothetical protein
MLDRALASRRSATGAWRSRTAITHGQTPTPTARAAHAQHLGWASSRRRPQTVSRAAGSRAPAQARARSPASRARHPPRGAGSALAPIARDLPGVAPCARGVEPRGISAGAVLSPVGPSPSHRRGGRRSGAPPGIAWPGGSLCARDQPRRAAPRPRLARALSCACSAHAARGAARAGLRAAQLPQAPARGGRDRPVQLRSLVRRVAAARRPLVGGKPGEAPPHLARGHRMAPSWGPRRLW